MSFWHALSHGLPVGVAVAAMSALRSRSLLFQASAAAGRLAAPGVLSVALSSSPGVVVHPTKKSTVQIQQVNPILARHRPARTGCLVILARDFLGNPSTSLIVISHGTKEAEVKLTAGIAALALVGMIILFFENQNLNSRVAALENQPKSAETSQGELVLDGDTTDSISALSTCLAQLHAQVVSLGKDELLPRDSRYCKKHFYGLGPRAGD